MLQQTIIAAAVLVAGCYVVWSFLPLLRRQWLLDVLARRGLLVRVAARHRARLSTPGCANCSAAEAHGKSARR
jgi:type III secretory pathway component EscT